MSKLDHLYAFVFKGLLTQETLESTPALRRFSVSEYLDSEVAKRLPLQSMDEDLVARSRRMATVYIGISAFENSVREFVSKKLLDVKKENWWQDCVSEKVRKKAESRKEEEEKIRWHTQRGEEPIYFTDFGELISIIIQNWDLFEAHLESVEWVKQMLKTVERSRNVIMHSGHLQSEDVERVGACIRDWIRQVGT